MSFAERSSLQCNQIKSYTNCITFLFNCSKQEDSFNSPSVYGNCIHGKRSGVKYPRLGLLIGLSVQAGKKLPNSNQPEIQNNTEGWLKRLLIATPTYYEGDLRQVAMSFSFIVSPFSSADTHGFQLQGALRSCKQLRNSTQTMTSSWWVWAINSHCSHFRD